MKKILLMLLALAIQPAFADNDGAKQIIVFKNGDPNDPNPQILTTKISNVSPSDRAFDWVPIGGKKASQSYTFTASGLALRAQAALPDVPQPGKFDDDVMGDPALTPNIYPFLPLLHGLAAYPQKLKALWALIVANPPPGFSETAIESLERYAQLRHMPLR